MNGAEVIPQVAWEQAVYVSLFIVLIVILVNWFSRQSDKWQSFIEASNDKWRKFSQEQRDDNNCAMGDVQKSLSDLTQVTGKLVATVDEMRTDIYQHDLQAKDILNKIESNAKPAPKSRAKKSDTPVA